MMHNENVPIQYTEMFLRVKIEKLTGKNYIFISSAQNIDCGYTLESKVRKIYSIPLFTAFLPYKMVF